jgi:hypothetical protein
VHLSTEAAHFAALVLGGELAGLVVEGSTFSVTAKYSSATVLSAMRA